MTEKILRNVGLIYMIVGVAVVFSSIIWRTAWPLGIIIWLIGAVFQYVDRD